MTPAKAAAKKTPARKTPTKKTPARKTAARKSGRTKNPPPAPAPAPVEAGAPRRLEWMAVSDLPEDTRNAKAHDAAALDASLERFGFTDPVEIDERTGLLVAGHGRKQALLRRIVGGHPAPDGVVVDDGGRWLVPVVRGWSSADDAEAAAYLAANNQLVIAGGFDEAALAELLLEASAAAGGLAGTAFSDDDLADLLASTDSLRFPDLDDPGEDGSALPVDGADEDRRTTPKFNTVGSDPDNMQVNAARRVVILDLPVDVFVWLVDALGRIGDELGLDSNAHTVVALVSERIGEPPPQMPAGPGPEAGGGG